MAKLGRPAKAVDLKSLGGKIRQAREKAGFDNLIAFAKLIGISYQSLQRIEAGVNNPSHQTLFAINERLGTDFKREGKRAVVPLSPRPFTPTVAIPLVGRIAAGQPIDFTETEGAVNIDPALVKLFPNSCAVTVVGESMVEHHILSKDVLICHLTPEPRNGSIVVTDLRDGLGATVKFWKRKGDQVTLSSVRYPGKDDQKWEYPAAKLGKVYEVDGLIRNLR